MTKKGDTSSEAGKGRTQRPKDQDKWDSNYSRIFPPKLTPEQVEEYIKPVMEHYKNHSIIHPDGKIDLCGYIPTEPVEPPEPCDACNTKGLEALTNDRKAWLDARMEEYLRGRQCINCPCYRNDHKTYYPYTCKTPDCKCRGYDDGCECWKDDNGTRRCPVCNPPTK